MNLSIRNDYSANSNLQNLRNTANATGLQTPRTVASSPPETQADPKLTASLQSTMKEQFAAQAQDPRAFHDLMAKVYGADYDQNKAEALRQKALAGDFSWLPPVRLLDSATLHGANGAYDAKDGVVYINADLAAKNPKLAAATYVEEAGAHLDTMLNRSDAAGDEGELFRRVMGGEKLSTQEVASIRAENDHGTIVVDGKEVAVEFWNPFKAIKNGVKAAAGAIKQAVTVGAKKVSGAVIGALGGVAKTFATALDGIKGFGENALGGLKKMTIGVVSKLVKGDIGGAFTSMFQGARDLTFGSGKAITSTVINTVGETLKIPTHLLPGGFGEKIRNGIDKATKVTRDIATGVSEVIARIVDIGFLPSFNFVGRLSTALKDLATLNFTGFGDSFAAVFKNLPTDFRDVFTAVTRKEGLTD
jgi:hypothetical protein